MVNRLRRALTLIRCDDGLAIDDPETRRRFVVSLAEAPIVERLLAEGLSLDELNVSLRDAGIDVTAEDYLELFRALKLLDGSAGADIQGELVAELEHKQLDAIRAIIAHARETIPYYEERFASLDEREIRTREDFSRLVPLLTRAEYRRNFPDRLLPRSRSYLAVSADPEYRVKQSSGTTAERVQVVQHVDYLMEIFAASFSYDNIFEARHAIFGPLRCMDMDCFVELPPFEERYLGHVLTMASADVMGQRPADAASLLSELDRTGITNVIANPYYLAFTTWRAREAGASPPAIRDLHLGYDYAQDTTRAWLERVYDCEARDIYGMAEGGYQMMRSCPRGGVHLNEDYFAFELLPAEGLASHRLVFTTLGNRFSPMIRYETSDLFQFDAARDRCPCGSPLRVVSRFDGRLADVIRIGDRAAPLGVVDRAIGAIDGLVMYQLCVDGTSVVVRALGEADPGEVKARVRGAMERVFDHAVDVVVRSVDGFELGRSGKFSSVDTVRGRP